MLGVWIVMVNLDWVPAGIGQLILWNLIVVYKSDRFKAVTYICFTIGLPIRQIACGKYYSIILSLGGNLYQIGTNKSRGRNYICDPIKLPLYSLTIIFIIIIYLCLYIYITL